MAGRWRRCSSDFGALPLRWVGTLLDQTLQALEAVHAAGIVHRDIKPANLLLEPTGRDQPHLRLTDFGIAAPMDEPRMTRASMAIGSPGYMPPEQWHGADPDPRQDIYAVGLVGLEMLTGIRPEVERAPIDLDALPEPRGLARELVAVLERAASPDPAARHASATELRRDLARLDLVNQTMAADDDIEVFDHFAASARAPADQTPTRRGLPYTAPEPTDRFAAATALGTASSTAVQPVSRSRLTGGGRRSIVPGLILVIVGVGQPGPGRVDRSGGLTRQRRRSRKHATAETDDAHQRQCGHRAQPRGRPAASRSQPARLISPGSPVPEHERLVGAVVRLPRPLSGHRHVERERHIHLGAVDGRRPPPPRSRCRADRAPHRRSG